MRKLFEIRADIQAAIEDMIYQDPEVARINIEDLEVEAEEKIRNCYWAIAGLNAQVAEAELVIKQAQDFKKKREEAIARIEADIKLTMEVSGLEKIDRPDCRITLGKPSPKVEVINEALIPAEWLRIIPEKKEPNKVEILKALKNGVKIEGVDLGYGEPRLTYPKLKGE